MQQRTSSLVLMMFAVASIAAASACAQAGTAEILTPIAPSHLWQDARRLGASQHKLYVVTFASPAHRHTCRIQSLTEDKLVCKRVFGNSRIYQLNQIAALIVPGDDVLRRNVLLVLTAGMGAGIWGTVALAAGCPACAVGTGLAAFFLFSAAGAIGMTDDVPDRLLYLAPGQQLSKKLGYVKE